MLLEKHAICHPSIKRTRRKHAILKSNENRVEKKMRQQAQKYKEKQHRGKEAQRKRY